MKNKVNWSESDKLKYASKYPKSRHELLFYLWYGFELHNVNIFKEGAEYSCRIGKTIHATYLRTINSLTFEQWRQRIESNYFSF